MACDIGTSYEENLYLQPLPKRKRMSVEEETVLSNIFKQLDVQHDLVEKIKAVTVVITRKAELFSSEAHTTVSMRGGVEKIPELCEKGKIFFSEVRELFSTLLQLRKETPEVYQRVIDDELNHAVHQLLRIAAYINFLETENLLTKSQACDMLGINSEFSVIRWRDQLLMDAWFQLAESLPKLAQSAATYGHYEVPVKISKFLTKYSMMCLNCHPKTDSIRKNIQQLKYVTNNVDNIVYDLVIRGLVKNPTSEPLLENTNKGYDSVSKE